MSHDTVTGRIIAGRYTITGHQRAGRMGDLYVARRVEDNARVSVKLLDPTLFDEAEAVSRFERETWVTRQLRHPCTMKVLDHGKSDQGVPWMVLEYVEGELLSEVLEEGPLPPARAAHVAGQVALALGEAHELGVVHRDLQPENILLTKQGDALRVKVREFGLSRLQSHLEEQATLTELGVRIGTPAYMAPEYIEDYELDHRADLYSLGVVLFEMLTGERPYQGRPYKVLDLHLTAPVPLPSSRVPSVPRWLDDLVAALMAKDPDARPQRAADVVAALERGLGTRPAVVDDAAPAPKAVKPAPQAKAPELDPILVHLINQNTISLKVVKGPRPDPTQCLLVERVGEPSLASTAGVRAGMYLELPEEPVTGLRDARLCRPVVRERRYVFATPGGQRLDLITTGIPVGVEVIRTAAHVRAFYDPLTSDPSALLDLWKQQDWEALERLSWTTLTQQRGVGGVFARLLGQEKIKLRDHPALVTYAVSLFEQGKPGGRELLDEYRSHYALNHPGAFAALACLYLGRDTARGGDVRQAAELVWESYVQWPLEQTAILLENLVKRRPENRAWFGRRFPEYGLESVDRRGGARLSDTLQRMGTDQLLVVCLLGGSRGNLDYDAFMHRYLSMGAWFHEVLFDLHVVTTEPRRGDDRPEHYEGEDLVVGAGLQLKVLEDFNALVQHAVKPAVIPTIYLIDKHGVVVHEGRLGEADLWEALALAGRRRLEPSRGA